MLKKFLNNSIWLILDNIITKIFFVIIIFYLTKNLWQEQYGTYSYLWSVLFFFAIIIDFWLAPFIIREVARNNIDWVKLFNIWIYQLFFFVIWYALFFTSTIFFDYWVSKELLFYFSIFSFVSILVNNIRNIFRWFNKTFFDFIIDSLLYLLLFLWIIILSPKDLISFAHLQILSITISFIFGLFILYKYFMKKEEIYLVPKLDIGYIKFMFFETLPFMIWIIAVAVYFKIDVVMIWKILNMQEVGIYSMAYNFIFLLTSFLILLMEAIYPIISKSFDNEKINMFNSYSKLFILVTISWIIFLYLFWNIIILYLFGEEYNNSIFVLKILLISITFFTYNKFIYYYLSTYNKQKIYSYVILLWGLLNFSLNLFAIPKYWINWAAFATLITEVFIYSILFIYIKISHRYVESSIFILFGFSLVLALSLISEYYLLFTILIISTFYKDIQLFVNKYIFNKPSE